MTQYLPSTVAGKVIIIEFYKNMRGENTITASEGTQGKHFITCEPFSGDRSHRVKFGRNTPKNRELAYTVMLQDLESLNMVDKGHEICTD